MHKTADFLTNYNWYASRFLKVKTKVGGVMPYCRFKWQQRFYEFCKDIKGPKRIYLLKPRQGGGSTEIGGIFSHIMATTTGRSSIVMADQSSRTLALSKIYSTFIQNLPDGIRPMIDLDNSERLTFDNPRRRRYINNPKILKTISKGLGNEILYQTALDENAGRSEPRLLAHLSEHAFYRYALKIDDSVQNSIPLHDLSWIIKESTANGMQGVGKPFYNGCQAAIRGDSLYKFFFVPWYEVEDYCFNTRIKITLTPYEKDMMKRVPDLTIGHIKWYRMKLSEYAEDEESWLSPTERMKQDFPITADDAFLNSGLPVFEINDVRAYIKMLTEHRPRDLKNDLGLTSYLMNLYMKDLKIFRPPREGREYYLGADVSEGLAVGDHSSFSVIDDEYNEVACWHGKIPPDIYGEFLMEVGEFYRFALLNPENNNMGHTTVTTIKNAGYPKIYKHVMEDKVKKTTKVKLGHTTTEKSKKDFLNELAKGLRKRTHGWKEIKALVEMQGLAREPNGTVNLNGKDRVVARGLALMARKHNPPLVVNSTRKPRKYSGTGKEAHDAFIAGKKSENDTFD